ncbi:hypothetical protein Barb6_01357 [Bacteroidales bacterium Barb6]|nr:hypothetical protein Barb6_01357 [Bacteroidales bacterium Barb6]
MEQFNKAQYINRGGELTLPQRQRSYYDCLSAEYQFLDRDTALVDLAYLVTNGFDLKQDIHVYEEYHRGNGREDIINKIIPTLVKYIMCMQYGDGSSYVASVALRFFNKLPQDVIIEILEKELKLRYNNHNHSVQISYWNEEAWDNLEKQK